APSRGAEDVCRTFGKRGAVLVERRELLAVAHSQLEVIADDLVEVAGLPCARVRGPPGEALVQPGAVLLRDAGVGGVPDQHVPEAIRVLAARARCEQILAREAEQGRV